MPLSLFFSRLYLVWHILCFIEGKARVSDRFTRSNQEDNMHFLHHTLSTEVRRDVDHNNRRRVLARISTLSEVFWFCLSFFLFLLMGPFSVFAVLIGLFSLTGEAQRDRMVEPEPIG